MAMDEISKRKRIRKPKRRYRLERELIPLLDLLNADPPPKDPVGIRDMTTKYLQLLEAKEKAAYTPQSRRAGTLPRGLSAASGALRTAIETGAISRVKECACGKYFFQKLPKQRFCSVGCRGTNAGGSDL